MSDKQSQDSVDQEDNVVAEGQSADAVDTKTNTEGELFQGEQKQEESLDLEAKPPKSKTAIIQREKQIDAWTLKVVRGEADIEELPKNLKWMRASIEENLKAMDKAARVEPDVEAIVEKKLAEKEAKRLFKEMKDGMQKLGLTKAQKLEITIGFNDLIKDGLPEHKALSTSLKMAGVSTNTQDQRNDQLFQSMSVPKGGSAPQEEGGPVETIEAAMAIPDEKKRLAELERLRTGRVPRNLQ